VVVNVIVDVIVDVDGSGRSGHRRTPTSQRDAPCTSSNLFEGRSWHLFERSVPHLFERSVPHLFERSVPLEEAGSERAKAPEPGGSRASASDACPSSQWFDWRTNG
jgi:hypothetical protein